MKRNTITTVCIVLICLLIAGAVGLTVFEIAQNNWKFEFADISKGLIVMIGLILSLVKLLSGRGHRKPLSAYEKAYREHIGSAFSRTENAKYKKELLRAAALYNEDLFDKALDKLEKLEKNCSTASDYSAVCFFKALCYTDSGRTAEAIYEYETVLKYSPKHSTALSNLGILYRKEGKSDAALACYRKAIELEPENAYAWNNLAQFYLTDGKWTEVIDPARRALELKSNMYQADTALCVAAHMLGRAEESRKHFERAVMNGANGNNIKNFIASLDSGKEYVPEYEYRAEIANALSILRRETIMPAAILEPTSASVKSRLGGAPIDRNIPLDSEGRPMRLLAAVWCSEVHGVPDLPARGVLRFYIADNDLCGMDLDEMTLQKDFRVLYDEDEDMFSAQIIPDAEISESFPVREPIAVRPALGSAIITPDDFRFGDAFENALISAGIDEGIDGIDGEEYDLINDEFNADIYSTLGGYPHFDQYDPREDDDELEKYDTLLLQIASLSENGRDRVMFGDMGQCQFFIPREKLRARDFSDIMYTWDCG